MIRFIDERGLIEPELTTLGAQRAVKEFGAVAAVTTFSQHIFDEYIKSHNAVEVAVVKGGIDMPIYGIEKNGKRVLAYKSPVGAPAAAMAAEEVYACGIRAIVAFGICGALTKVPERTIVVPTKSYRDEGTSLHYVPYTDVVELKNSAVVAKKLAEYGISTECGAAWTTDALYRETPTRLAEMKKAGCIAVDMECSALQSVADYRGKEFYTFFVTADSLADEEWNPNYILDVKVAKADAVGAAAAVRIASEIL